MSFTRQEFAATLADKARKRQNESLPAIRAVQAAGVVMAKLTTGSDEWNRYLSLLQGRLEETQRRKDAAQLKQNDPAIWEAAQLNKLKADILQCDAMIDTLHWCMAIPKALVDGGQEATEFLNKMEHKDEPTGQSQP